MDQIRRLPADQEGRTAILLTAGDGQLADMADRLEDRIVEVALQDADRAEQFCSDDLTSPAGLRMALRFSVVTVRRIVELAGAWDGGHDGEAVDN